MPLDEETLEARRLFMSVAIMEHHQMFDPTLSTYDICERLGKLWQAVQQEANAKFYDLEADKILMLNHRVTLALDSERGEFLNRDRWQVFIDELNDVNSLEEDDVQNWIFGELYWGHLTRCRFATVWIFINALNLQYKRPLNQLSIENLGSFLDSLSGAGPPLQDGQTFYPQDYT